MSQGAFIVAALAGGFVLYLARTGRLAAYAGAMLGHSPASLPTVRGGGGGP
jgi:hypothetical protein